jgi:hypothetical protein
MVAGERGASGGTINWLAALSIVMTLSVSVPLLSEYSLSTHPARVARSDRWSGRDLALRLFGRVVVFQRFPGLGSKWGPDGRQLLNPPLILLVALKASCCSVVGFCHCERCADAAGY